MLNSIPSWLQGIHGQNYSDLIKCHNNPSMRENRIAIKLIDEILPSSDFRDFRYIVMNEWKVDPSRPFLGKGDLVMTNGKNLLVIEIKSICSKDPKIRMKGLLKVIRQARYYALVVKRYRDFCLFKDYRLNILFRQAKVHSAFFTNLDSDIILLNRVSEKNLSIKDKDLHMKGITVEEIYKNNRLDRQDIIDEENNQIEGFEGTEKEGFIDIEGENESKKKVRMKEGLENLLEIVISSDEEDNNDEDIVFYNEVAVHKPNLILLEKQDLDKAQVYYPQKLISSDTQVTTNLQGNKQTDNPEINFENRQKLIQDKINKVKEKKSQISQLLRPLDEDETWINLDNNHKVQVDNDLQQKRNYNGVSLSEQNQKYYTQQNVEQPQKIAGVLQKQQNKENNQVDYSEKKQQKSNKDNWRNLQLLSQKFYPKHNLTSNLNENKTNHDITDRPAIKQQLNRNRSNISEFQAKLQHLIELRIASKQLQDRKNERNEGEQTDINKQNTVIQIQDDDEEEEEQQKVINNDRTEAELKKFIESSLALKQSDRVKSDKLKMLEFKKMDTIKKMKMFQKRMKLRKGNILDQAKECSTSNFIDLENEEGGETNEFDQRQLQKAVKRVAFSFEKSIKEKPKKLKYPIEAWKKKAIQIQQKKKKYRNRLFKRDSKKISAFQDKQRKKKKFTVKSSTDSSLDKDTEEGEFEFDLSRMNEDSGKNEKKIEKNHIYKIKNSNHSQDSLVLKKIKLKIINPRCNTGDVKPEEKDTQRIPLKIIKLTIKKDNQDALFKNEVISQKKQVNMIFTPAKQETKQQLKIIKIQKKKAEECNEIREQEFIPLPVKKIKIAIRCAKAQT